MAGVGQNEQVSIMSEKLKLEFTGSLTKNATTNVKGNVIKKGAIKMMDTYEICQMVQELSKWAGDTAALGRLADCVSNVADDNPWTSLPVSLLDYDLYFTVDFGSDENYNQTGMKFDMRLTSLKISKKTIKVKDEMFGSSKQVVLQCVLNYDKAMEDSDITLETSFLGYTENDPRTGKKIVKPFNVSMELRDRFTIGSEPESSID